MATVTVAPRWGVLENIDTFMSLEKAQVTKVQDKLIEENHALGGHMNGFYFGGQLISNMNAKFTAGQSIPGVHPSLQDRARDFFEDRQKLKIDISAMKSAAVVILDRCSCAQDVRDSLPEPLAKIGYGQVLERINDEGHALREHPKLWPQFERLQKLVYFYQANKLIY